MTAASPERTEWTHNICERCLFLREPERFPIMLRRGDGDRAVDRCCFCGSLTVTRIWLREDPRSPNLICQCRADEP